MYLVALWLLANCFTNKKKFFCRDFTVINTEKKRNKKRGTKFSIQKIKKVKPIIISKGEGKQRQQLIQSKNELCW